MKTKSECNSLGGTYEKQFSGIGKCTYYYYPSWSYVKQGDKINICENTGTWKLSGNGYCASGCYATSSNRKYVVFTNESKDTFYDYVGGNYKVELPHNDSTNRSFCIEFNLTDDNMGYYGKVKYSCWNGNVTLSIENIDFTHNDSYCKDESGSWDIKRGRPDSQDCAGHTNRKNYGSYISDSSPSGAISCISGKL